MSHAISLQRPLTQHTNAFQLEQNQHAGENAPWLGTAAKGTLIALGVIGSIASFALLPVASALLFTGLIVVLALAGLSCFSKCFPNNSHPIGHQHPHHTSASVNPWYHRMFSSHAPLSIGAFRPAYYPPTLPTSRPGTPRSNVPTSRPGVPIAPIVPPPPPAPRHVGVGRGTGHLHPPVPAHVGVGRGHTPPTAPTGRGGHVGPGTGHFHPPGPVSSDGRVGRGRGHF